jgi:hypothetical protein
MGVWWRSARTPFAAHLLHHVRFESCNRSSRPLRFSNYVWRCKPVLSRIHVNQHVIRRNQREGNREPPLTVKTYNSNVRCHEVEVGGPSRIVYQPDQPLACGARVWVETTAPVVTR